MVNAHEHISGRPREYISRKWFHRGRHRPNAHRETVDEITQQLNAELAEKHPTGFHMSADGKYLVWQGRVTVAEDFDPTTTAVLKVGDGLTPWVALDAQPSGLLSKLEGGPW